MILQLTPQAMPAGYGEGLLPLAACKAHLGFIDADVTEFDGLIAALRDAAVDAVERYTNLFLAPRVGVVAKFSCFGGTMRLGRGPDATVIVTAVAYPGSDGVLIEMAEGSWRVLAGGKLSPAIGAVWPVSYGDVTVTFDAGFADSACPPGLLTAAKMFLAHLYANREAVVSSGVTAELPLGFRMLCDQHRMPVL